MLDRMHFTPKRNSTDDVFSPIEVAVPERPAGQQDVIQLTTPKLDTVRVGFIGLGMRGPGAVERWTHIPGTKIVALCDYFPKMQKEHKKSSPMQEWKHRYCIPVRKMHEAIVRT